jgi:hypothetical protein
MLHRSGIPPSRLSRQCLCVVVVGLAATGCGGGRTSPVHGTVSFTDGDAPARELKGYTVTFESLGEQVSATGEVQEDGSFRLSTFSHHDGAVPGRHRVAITPPLPQGDEEAPILIDERYFRFETSGLEVTVGSGATDIELRLDRATAVSFRSRRSPRHPDDLLAGPTSWRSWRPPEDERFRHPGRTGRFPDGRCRIAQCRTSRAPVGRRCPLF